MEYKWNLRNGTEMVVTADWEAKEGEVNGIPFNFRFIEMIGAREDTSLVKKGEQIPAIELYGEDAKRFCKMIGVKKEMREVKVPVQNRKFIEEYTALLAKEAKEKKERERNAFESLTDNDKVSVHKQGTYFFAHLEEKDANESIQFKIMVSTIKDSKINIETVLEQADNMDWGDYSTSYSWETTYGKFKQLYAAAKELLEEKEKAAKERQKARDERIQAIFQKAKETGENQELERWTAECNDPHEECSLDTVVIYATPDGKTIIKRYHTW